MQVIDCIQGSDEWFAARLGKVSASNFGKVMAGGAGKTRKSYMMKLVAERLTGERQAGFSNENMENGIEREAEAREYYEALNRVTVEQVGFIELNDDVGASPDGLIGDDGGIEIKCPLAATHIETILAKKVPTVYIPQIQGNMWVSERDYWDFVSYHPFVEGYHLWQMRVKRDEEYIKNLAAKVELFVSELKETIELVRKGPVLF